MPARLDHLVISADALRDGALALEQALGVPLAGGGQHARMGTHNRVLRVGEAAYLEVIAVDPACAAPARPRWLGLDDPAPRLLLARGPRLIHWVARVERGEHLALPFDVGPWEAFSRGDLSWQLTVRGDGALPAEGVVPSLILWDGPAHPWERLPEAGVSLEALELEHPRAADVQRQLDLLGLPYRCTSAPVPRITAHLRTPGGTRTLRSTEPIR